MEDCSHSITIRGMCAICGKDLYRCNIQQSTSVAMVHANPELRVTEDYAKKVGKADQQRLLSTRKLILVVDLDLTLLHTTHENVKDDNVFSFQLSPNEHVYHTKLRPFIDVFLERMHKLYELHIFTFGCRRYAHKIAEFMDPSKKYFEHRILSRDESVDQMSKRGNLKDLFPCGDSMVCIIDDRADVWGNASNLIQVAPYFYFKSTGDINEIHKSNPIKIENKEGEEGEKEKLEVEEEKKKSEIEEKGDETKDATKEEDKVKEKKENQEDNEKEARIRDDLDTYLLLLAERLEEIHSKFYEELDERVKYLSEGEQYKIPDLKEIIPRVIRKRR